MGMGFKSGFFPSSKKNWEKKKYLNLKGYALKIH
jgi:hypothetical protein